MVKYLISLLSVLIIGCDFSSDQSENCFPSIIIERNKDKLSIGDTYKAKFYLNDESYYFMIHPDGTKRAILPVFKINDELVESNQNFCVFEEEVTSENLTKINTGEYIRQWSCSIAFPHPKSITGVIEINGGTSYRVE